MSKLDNGTGCFRVDHIEQKRGEALASVLTRVRSRYAKGLIWIEQERARYEHSGETHDAA